MSLTLPKPITNYLAAVEATDTVLESGDSNKIQVSDGATRRFRARKDCATPRPVDG
jgi:hypothetical protein